MTLFGRVVSFFEPENTWERPRPANETLRSEMLRGLVYMALASGMLELARSVAAFDGVDLPVWAQHVVIWLGVLPLAVRRRYPVAVMVLSHMYLIWLSMQVSTLSVMWSTQIAGMVAIYSAGAWARDRKLFLVALGGIVLANLTFNAYTFALGSAFADFQRQRETTVDSGVLPPLAAFVIYQVLVNLIYILASAVGGQLAWRTARQRELLRQQNEQLVEQAGRIKDQAQTEERLRIARELHDVVAHHVSVIGVQAAGARKVLHRNPALAEQALSVVEDSSRRAVTEMRSLLGTLRSQGASGTGAGPDRGATAAGRSSASGDSPVVASGAAAGQAEPDRAPDPTARDIRRLVEDTVGLDTNFAEVEDRPGAVAGIPPGVGLALYRTVQEALANVRRHSTATAADVTIRVGTDQGGGRYAEAEILDEGRPRRNTSGSGLGLLGLRERIASLNGTSEIGPRATGGYRVRIRFPIPADRAHLKAV